MCQPQAPVAQVRWGRGWLEVRGVLRLVELKQLGSIGLRLDEKESSVFATILNGAQVLVWITDSKLRFTKDSNLFKVIIVVVVVCCY